MLSMDREAAVRQGDNEQHPLQLIKLTLKRIQAQYHRHIENITALQQRIADEETELKLCLEHEKLLRAEIDQRLLLDAG